MQAITTKYIGPSNMRGSRIKATCWRKSVSIPYPHELSGIECHKAAAVALLAALDEEDGQGSSKFSASTLIGGGMPDGNGYAFVVVLP